MKYLYENGYRVISMKDLGYDEMSNHLYVKMYRNGMNNTTSNIT